MKKIRIIAIILVLLIVVLGVGYVVLRRVPAETYAVEEVDSEAHWGTIRGSLGYPAEGIPDMGVCAESITGVETFCTYTVLEDDEFTYGFGYELKVPPDNYYVYAHLVTEGNESIGYTDEYKAYYSKYVTCGGSISCTSHSPIKLSVARNQNINGIDPIDWYAE